MPPALLDALITEALSDVDLLFIEGAMGLFDGVPGNHEASGAVSDLAARYGLPVILVLDVSAQAQTAAAVLRGMATHDPRVKIAGVVLNRVASDRHRDLVFGAMRGMGIPILGSIPRDSALALPARHLGLVQAGEHADLGALLDRIADTVEGHVDLDGVLALARPLDVYAACGTLPLAPPGNRIALASDAAFTFMYPHLLSAWRKAGAKVTTFSPLADEPPPDFCDCCWLPGGYPELHARRLAEARKFREGLRRFARTRPVHGECGGYMVLGESLQDADGVRHTMAGLLSHSTSFASRHLHLGYRQARLLTDCPIGPRGTVLRGHEFHYSTLSTRGDDAYLAEITDAQGRRIGPAGGWRGNVTGTFFHAIASETVVPSVH